MTLQLVGSLVANVGEILFNQADGVFIKLLKIVGAVGYLIGLITCEWGVGVRSGGGRG